MNKSASRPPQEERPVDSSGWPGAPVSEMRPLASRSWMGPTCLAVAVGSTLIVLVWLWAASWPGGLGLAQVGVELVVLGFGLSWAALVAIHLAGRWQERSSLGASKSTVPVQGSVALTVAGLMLFSAVGLVANDAALRVRFELSRPAFNEAAARAEVERASATAQERAEADSSGEPLAAMESSGPLGRYPSGRVSVRVDSISIRPPNPMFALGWFEYFPDGPPAFWDDPELQSHPYRIPLGDGWWAAWFSPI